MPNLERLNLSGRRIQELPSDFHFPPNLKWLQMAEAEIDRFPEQILELTDLEVLDFHGNHVKEIPEDLTKLRKLRFIDLAENPLSVPPEILDRPSNPTALLDFIKRARASKLPLNEAKLIVVGEGSVGKTSLFKQLTQETFNPGEDKTEGIDITRWNIQCQKDDISLNIWDFGGQEMFMHATHQFFLTKRSVYVLVIDARQGDEQNRIEYWLKLIQSFQTTLL